MKNFTLIILFSLFALSSVYSQKHKIQFKNGDFTPEINIDKLDKDSDPFKKALYKDNYYLFVQFEEMPSLERQEELRKEGVELLSYIPNHSYWIKMKKKTFKNNSSWKKGIRHISNLDSKYKYPATVEDLGERFLAYVVFQESINETDAKKALDGNYMEWKSFQPKMVKIYLSKEQLKEIASLAIVNYISPTFDKTIDLVSQNIETHRIKKLTHSSGLNLSGNGITVSVGDGGTIEQHLDLNDRIMNENAIGISSHGSATSGIIAGEGILRPDAKGIAPRASLYAAYSSNVIINDDALYTAIEAVISNNSYAGNVIVSTCVDAGDYTAESMDVDQSLRTLDEVQHVFAAGNDGWANCTPYSGGYSSIKNAWQSAKNTLTVGATDYLNNIWASSSRGPVKDGRLKPEIVAVGQNVSFTSSNNNYSAGSGTSYACPTVAGTLALLNEHYKNLNGGTNPRGDLMKAIVCNTADDQGNAGPDYIYGFGSLNATKAAEVITNGTYFTGSVAAGGTPTHNIVLPAAANQLKIMLYWHDEEASIGASPALVNNLDVTVNDGVTTTLPLVLDPSAANCANPAVQGTDALNNIEQIVIDNPAAATYTVTVAGTTVPLGSQDYVLVYDVISDMVELSSPLGGEIFEPNENVNITWEASGFDANDFTLEYSTDNGGVWNMISSTVPGTDRNYEWTVPSTITDQGLIRITWNSTGLPTSQSLTNFSIIDTPNDLDLTTDCDNNIVLTWSASSGATDYDVMEYTGGNWLVINNTPLTTYTASGLTNGQDYYYTVRANSGSVVGEIAQGLVAKAMGTVSGIINTFPYSEDFESSNGDWFSDGKNDSWAWGAPSGTIIDRAAEGTNCWVSNLSGNYNDAGKAFLYSPCFDLSSMTSPVIAFGMNYNIEHANDGFGQPFYDFLQLQYSTNGETWTTLGTNGTGHNWYNNYMSNNVWDSLKGYWHGASYDIPTTASRVNFRYLLRSDGFTNEEGVGIDNIMIYESKSIHSGSTVTGTSLAVSGTSWIDFESSGNLLASINPNGNNLGSTTVDTYVNGGTVRSDGDQYYLDRNWKITPTNPPGTDVSVRLYFLDSEVELLRAATTPCGTCTTLDDAFIAGVTKYSGVNENGVLSDNDVAGHSFIIPADAEVKPFANGYYIEFDVSSFSEFYINGGGVNRDEPLPVELTEFTARKDKEDAILNWTTASEINSGKFEIEVARNRENIFEKIGEVKAQGNSTELQSYEFVDSELNKSGLRYYRLKSIDLDGTYEYSDTKVLDFSKGLNIYIYPNPSIGEFNINIKNVAGENIKLRLFDELGRTLLNEEYESNSDMTEIKINGNDINLIPGIYLLEINQGEENYMEKIIINP